MKIKKGDYSVIPDEEKDKSNNKGSGPRGDEGQGEVGSTEFEDDVKKMEEIPQTGNSSGIKTFRDFDSAEKEIKTEKPREIQKSGTSKIVKKISKPNWDELSSGASSRSNLSDAAKKMIKKLKSTEPVVDWRKELKKFFDQTFKSMEWILPNKRYLAGGDIMYGRKQVGEDTLKTIVAAVDTSSSISKPQIKLFIKEVMGLVKKFDADKTIIIYCSDDIDNIDIVKKGGDPDFTKIASTGGNRRGFIPPFQWVEKNKINPSVFVYLTDTGGEMPDPSRYGIRKYAKKTFWFICSPMIYNQPTFGKIIHVPVAGLK